MTEKKGLARTNATVLAYIKVAVEEVVGSVALIGGQPKNKEGGAETWQLTGILFDASHHLK